RRCPNVLYSIVGEGWEREHLNNVVAEAGAADVVQFRGMPDDRELVECYQQCDMFALPNRQVNWDFEGFGIVLLEAQACGKAVIAGMSGGTAETLQPDVTGVIVPCETPVELAAATTALLTTPARLQEMGARGRERAVTKFDWSVLTRRSAEYFHRAG